MSKFDDIGVALAGTGFMAWVHAEALRRLGISVVGILGSTPEKSQQAAKRLGIPTAYASFDELLADETTNAVHIVMPNRLHFSMARDAILAGKHVLCEKPLAMNTAESSELVKLARQHTELACGVNYNIRYYPLCIEARERIRQGELGKLFHICGSYVQDWLLWPTDYNWRVLAEEGGELRAVADIGTHWLDLVSFLTDVEVESVCADLSTVHERRQRPRGEVTTFASSDASRDETEAIEITTEDYGSILLRFADGMRGSLSVSQVTAGRKNCLRVELSGSQQAMSWCSEQPNELWIGHRERANEVLLRDPLLLSPAAQMAADYPGGHNEGYADTFKACFRDFYQHISEGKLDASAGFPAFADGHREIQICEAILTSHRERRWVNLNECDKTDH